MDVCAKIRSLWKRRFENSCGDVCGDGVGDGGDDGDDGDDRDDGVDGDVDVDDECTHSSVWSSQIQIG